MSSNELLQQLTQALTQVLGGGNNGGLGFCPIPENQNAVKYLFPGYEECGAGRPPYLIALGDNNARIPIPQPAIKGKLKFLNLIDTTTGGVDKQKLEFWIDCGAKTYVIYLGWADQNGKLNNATESFLKALASLTLDELLEPFTFTLSRLVDKPSFDPSKGGVGAAKVLLVDVWKHSGESVYYEQSHMDANAACSVILRINQHLTGQAVLTPRQPKAKTQALAPTPQPQIQQQWGQQPQQYQQPAPVPQPQAQPQQWGQPQPTPQPQVQQALPVVGGLTPEQMQQFLAFQQQQQSQNLPQPQPTPLEQAQQSIAQPQQWGSPAPQPAPIQNGNGNGKVNW